MSEDAVPDYTKLSPGDMLSSVADDAKKWADAFMQFTDKYDHPVNHAGMIDWFANAIESSYNLRYHRLVKAGRIADV